MVAPVDTRLLSLQARLDHGKKDLAANIEMLINRLERAKEQLSKPDPSLNSLGEVQGLGTSIDTGCARVMVLKETIQLLEC